MDRHVKRVHEGKKAEPFKCFAKDDLKKHVESAHEKKKPFKCKICDKHFSFKHNMKEHFTSIHGKK